MRVASPAIELGLGLGLSLVGACAFQPGGAADGVADGVADAASAGNVDAAVSSPSDARVFDAPAVPVDAAPEEGVLRATALSGTPILDGMPTELAGATRYTMDLASSMNAEMVAGYTPSMTAGLRAGYDATHVHLFFDVAEAKPHQGDSANTWENDAITFYIDGAGDRAGAYGPDDHEIIIDYRPVYGIYPSTNGTDPVIEAVRLPTTEGFTVEVRIPRASIGAAQSSRIGFAWGIYDDDGGGAAEGYGLHWMRQAPRCASCCTSETRAQAWCDTTLLGELVFN
jgi:hypothetical protein